jgi:hypothetical protein
MIGGLMERFNEKDWNREKFVISKVLSAVCSKHNRKMYDGRVRFRQEAKTFVRSIIGNCTMEGSGSGKKPKPSFEA